MKAPCVARVLLALSLLSVTLIRAQDTNVLRDSLERRIQRFRAETGIAVMDLQTGDTLSVHGLSPYTMASTYKTPLALYVLKLVDLGKLSLGQTVHITKRDLPANTWSPLQKKYPDGNIDFTLAELLNYTVSKSDNNTCDILFRLVGGPARVEAFVHGLGYKNMAIRTTEAEMEQAHKHALANRCSPFEMTRMLADLEEKKWLSDSANAFLLSCLTETENSPKRLKAGLPQSVSIAHKTGTGRNVVNDAGIIYLAGRKPLVVSVYIQSSKESFEDAEALIADVSRLVYRH